MATVTPRQGRDVLPGQRFQRLEKTGLVSLDHHQVVRTLVTKPNGGTGLGVQGIDSDHHLVKVVRGQQSPQELVKLFV